MQVITIFKVPIFVINNESDDTLRPLWNFPGGPVIKTLSFNAEGTGSIPDGGTKIPHATWCGQNIKILK